MKESEIQRKITLQLEKRGWIVVKLIKTTMNGIPDLMALKFGKTVYIEVKTDKGVTSELQKFRHEIHDPRLLAVSLIRKSCFCLFLLYQA